MSRKFWYRVIGLLAFCGFYLLLIKIFRAQLFETLSPLDNALTTVMVINDIIFIISWPIIILLLYWKAESSNRSRKWAWWGIHPIVGMIALLVLLDKPPLPANTETPIPTDTPIPAETPATTETSISTNSNSCISTSLNGYKRALSSFIGTWRVLIILLCMLVPQMLFTFNFEAAWHYYWLGNHNFYGELRDSYDVFAFPLLMQGLLINIFIYPLELFLIGRFCWKLETKRSVIGAVAYIPVAFIIPFILDMIDTVLKFFIQNILHFISTFSWFSSYITYDIVDDVFRWSLTIIATMIIAFIICKNIKKVSYSEREYYLTILFFAVMDQSFSNMADVTRGSKFF